LHDIAWILSLRSSTLSEWNRIFDEHLNALQIPDQRGKAGAITADLVRQVVKAALGEKKVNNRLRLKSFTRKLKKQGIILSRKTVSDILTANGLYQVKVKNRRPRFYQSLRQSIPNSLLSIDGKEFKVVIGNEAHTFNLEMAVDVHSFAHSAFSVSDTETTAEFIKVLEDHCLRWGKPLAVVTDHGSANLSEAALAYLRDKDIEILPAGPGNPKGNGTVESAFSGMEKVIGTIFLDTSSPRALAKSVLEKVISTYVIMRNRLSRQRTPLSPETMMQTPTTPGQQRTHKAHYKQRAENRRKPVSTARQDRLQWVISHHKIAVDENAMDRARKCIEHYDLETISKTEEAFLRAVSRNQDRCNLSYFFGILKNIQADLDTARHKEYCRERYNYQQMKDRERQRARVEQDRATIGVMVETICAAITCPLGSVRDAAITQAGRMMFEVRKQFGQVASIKKKVFDILNGLKDLSVGQRDEVAGLVDQFLT
jgi:transposase InsO family protein